MMKYPTMVFAGGLLLVWFSSCVEVRHLGGTCEVTSDCHTEENYQPEGSICTIVGICACPVNQVGCCPKGPPGVCAEVCPPEHACTNPPDAGSDEDAGSDDDAWSGGDAGSDGDAGCINDADCPQPADRRCGQGRCVEGACVLDIKEGPLAAQKYGDCRRRECTMAGAVVEVEDSLDFYDDGRTCTIDYCAGGPVHWELAEGTPCPGMGAGYCHQNECVECITGMLDASCGAGLTCTSIWCVDPQCSGTCGDICAPCPTGKACTFGADCESRNCSGGMCQLPTCNDGAKNDGETGVDCGTAKCGDCPDGEGCVEPDDCISDVCKAGACQAPTCFDGVQNGNETGEDCGPSPCEPCL
jgi:hypothetical protein